MSSRIALTMDATSSVYLRGIGGLDAIGVAAQLIATIIRRLAAAAVAGGAAWFRQPMIASPSIDASTRPSSTCTSKSS